MYLRQNFIYRLYRWPGECFVYREKTNNRRFPLVRSIKTGAPSFQLFVICYETDNALRVVIYDMWCETGNIEAEINAAKRG